MEIENLVFEGGGIKGVAYIGAIKSLIENQIYSNIKRVSGASVGSLTALLLSLGYSYDEIYDEIMSFDFKSLLDDSFGVIRDTIRVLSHYGWHPGKVLSNWVEELIVKKTGNHALTFLDLHKLNLGPDLYVLVSNLSTGKVEIFSYECDCNFPISIIVRASMSVPLMFKAIKINDNLYVDGGLLNNFPIRIFDQRRFIDQNDDRSSCINYGTIGFRLGNNMASESINRIDSFPAYINALVDSMMSLQELRHSDESDWVRTIQIPTFDYTLMDFDLNESDKNILIQSGYNAVNDFFEKELSNE